MKRTLCFTGRSLPKSILIPSNKSGRWIRDRRLARPPLQRNEKRSPDQRTLFLLRAEFDTGSFCATCKLMLGRLAISLVATAGLFCGAVRLPAAPCLITNTAGPKACAPGCCKNKSCCDTSNQRTGPISQPIAKAGLDQQDVAPVPTTLPVAAPISGLNESQFISYAEPRAHSPPLLPLLCTFLI